MYLNLSKTTLADVQAADGTWQNTLAAAFQPVDPGSPEADQDELAEEGLNDDESDDAAPENSLLETLDELSWPKFDVRGVKLYAERFVIESQGQVAFDWADVDLRLNAKGQDRQASAELMVTGQGHIPHRAGFKMSLNAQADLPKVEVTLDVTHGKTLVALEANAALARQPEDIQASFNLVDIKIHPDTVAGYVPPAPSPDNKASQEAQDKPPAPLPVPVGITGKVATTGGDATLDINIDADKGGGFTSRAPRGGCRTTNNSGPPN